MKAHRVSSRLINIIGITAGCISMACFVVIGLAMISSLVFGWPDLSPAP